MRLANLEFDERRLAGICERFQVAEFYVFGSALRDDFTQASDVDILYVLDDDAGFGWGIEGRKKRYRSYSVVRLISSPRSS